MIGTTHASYMGYLLEKLCQNENLPLSAAEAENWGNLPNEQMPEKMKQLRKSVRGEVKMNAIVKQLMSMEIQQKQKEERRTILNQSLSSFELYRQMIYRDVICGTFFTLCLKTDQDGKYGEFERQKYYWLSEWDTWKQDVHKTRGVCDWIISPAIYDISSVHREFKNITHIYSFWADFDVGTIGHKKATLFKDSDACRNHVMNNLKRLDLVPTLWFFSGYGFHAYWCVQDNLIGTLDQDQIENMNETLYQAAVGSDQHYNEIRAATTLVRSPFPATNLKNVDAPIATKLEQLHGIYDLADLIKRAPPVMPKQQTMPKQKIIPGSATNQIQPKISTIKIHRIGDIEKVLADTEFMEWIYNSSDLNYYRNSQCQHDSTSGKEAWIFFYLWLCGHDAAHILEFFHEHADREYHLFRKRKIKSAQLKRIEDTILAKNEKAEHGQCSAKIRDEHVLEANWNVN